MRPCAFYWWFIRPKWLFLVWWIAWKACLVGYCVKEYPSIKSSYGAKRCGRLAILQVVVAVLQLKLSASTLNSKIHRTKYHLCVSMIAGCLISTAWSRWFYGKPSCFLFMSNHPLLTPSISATRPSPTAHHRCPMAGVTDKPFRMLAKSFGAGHAVSEMMTSDATLFAHHKTLYRANFEVKSRPFLRKSLAQTQKKSPKRLALSSCQWAQIVDINMGCPAKSLQKLAGSALLKDEDLVKRLLDATERSLQWMCQSR